MDTASGEFVFGMIDPVMPIAGINKAIVLSPAIAGEDPSRIDLPSNNTNGLIDCLSGLFNPAALWIHADKGGFPMSAAVGGRDDYDALPLRGLSRASEDLRQVRRLLSLACVYDGMSRADAAKGDGRDRQREPEGPGAPVPRRHDIRIYTLRRPGLPFRRILF